MYVTLQDDGSEDDLSYIKLINYGQKVVTNRMHGYLRMRIAQFLTTIHTTPHVIYLTRHGQSEYNLLGKIGGNPPLSEAGREYAQRLAAWVPENVCKDRHDNVRRVRLWTSSLQRTIRTADYIPHPLLSAADCGPGEVPENERSSTASDRSRKPISTPPLNASAGFPPIGDRLVAGGAASFTLPATAGSGSGYPSELQLPADIDGLAPVGSYNSLNRLTAIAQKPSEPLEPEEKWEQMSPRVYRNLDEIFAGEYEGLTYEEIKKKAPDEASLRAMDKIGYRYPRGESYYDILARLDPLVHEMESYHEPLMIVCHQAVLRVLYSYLLAKPRKELTKQVGPYSTR
jgi:broad specificity phosphatase PhoE